MLALPHPESKWRGNPTNGDWDLAENWVPTRVPNAVDAQAVFSESAVTNVTTASANVHSVTFNPGASHFTINGLIVFNNGGVINESGLMQTFNGTIYFQKGAVGGNSLVTYNTNGRIEFQKGTTAGDGTYVNDGTLSFKGGLRAGDEATAGSANIINNSFTSLHKADGGTATFTNNGGTTFGAEGGTIRFAKSSAQSCTIINNGGAVFGGGGARLIFNRSSADAATLIANGGAGPGSGATILFMNDSTGDLCRIEVFGNGSLDVSRPDQLVRGVGSIEGDGLIFLGSNFLNVGANDLSTSFDGVISDMGGLQDGTGGSLTKSGLGTLTLTNANTYTGVTVLTAGALFVNNVTDSGTGAGAVQVDAGTLGGQGTIAGAVTLGTGSGSGGSVAPGSSVGEIGDLTIQGSLAVNADGVYLGELSSDTQTADAVIANV